MRLRNDPKALEKLASAPNLVRNFPLHVDERFVLELGAGKGEMLINLARKNPHFQYIGVERSATVLAKATRAAADIKNLQFVLADVNNFAELLTGKVSTIWITFPDPWPKKRHASRRLLHRNTLKVVKELLAPNGKLLIKTDNDALFDFGLEELQAAGWKVHMLVRDLWSHEGIANEPTGYELKWAAKGKAINYLEATLI